MKPAKTLEQQRRQGDLYRLLVQSVKDYAIFMLDPAGHVMTWNEGAQRLHGYRVDEIIGKHFSIFYPPAEVQRGKIEDELRVAVDEGRYEEEGWRVRKDGSLFWASAIITALHDAGELVGFAKVTRDLTERKRAEEERTQLLALERAAREKNEFLSIAAHELRTPMTTLRLAAQALERRLDADAAAEFPWLGRGLSTIDRQVTKLTRLVNQLLETIRMDANRLDLERKRLNLTALVRDTVQHIQPSSNQHEIVMTTTEPVWALVDEMRMEQVVSNLIDNAVKFSPTGGRIDVGVSPGDAHTVILTVRDRGVGVAEEHRGRLFEQFYQAHPNLRSGMGLGLYIVHGIVTAHGGQIRAEFPADGGSTFIVELPADGRTLPTSPTADAVRFS